MFSVSVTLKQEDVFNISSFYLLKIVVLYSCRVSYLVIVGLSNTSAYMCDIVSTYRVCQKTDDFCKFVTRVYDDIEKHSIYQMFSSLE